MTHDFLSYFWYFALALVWVIYIVQEGFITGGSMISLFYKKDEEKYKEINSNLALHWDGIQVWLVLAVGGLFAAFPSIYATMLSNLYIPFFLLLYAILFRGISIEVLYKTDSKKFRNILQWFLAVSSFLIILVLGIYLMVNFIGLPIGADGLNTTFFSFLVIFSPTAILGGLLFVVFSLMVGHLFIKLAIKDINLDATKKYLDWISLAFPLLLAAVFLAFSNVLDVFERGLFAEYPVLYILPALCVLFGILATVFFKYNRNILSFISSILTMVIFIFVGFISMIPYFVVSTTNSEYGISITDGAAGSNTLTVMFIATVIFLPIVISYQTFKYIKFWRKV